ncbi:MAG: Maf family protein [Thermodesulfobacteriota bacterium]|nr:Maf family protein [Thermodesulfobacteriota bacterium]
MKQRPLILASASPRRRELLALLDLEFEVRPSRIDESPEPGESPAGQVRRLAEAKARQIAKNRPGCWILAADTIVVHHELVMGKPKDRAGAARMLSLLSGQTHEVLTGYCLLNQELGQNIVDYCRTEVEFRPLSGQDIETYLDSGEPGGKAGAYAIQGRGAALVKRVAGSYTNVVGLPLAETVELLRHYGLAL